MLKYLIISLLFCFNCFSQTANEIIATCLTLEAGGEVDNRAMAAVFEAIQNRAAQRNKSLLEVVLQSKAFSCYNSGNIQNKVKYAQKHKKYEKALRIVVNNQKTNFTNRATNYWTDSIKPPAWAKNRKITKIGRHNFIRL